MKREECSEGMNVRVIDNPSEPGYEGQTGVVVRVRPYGSGYKWDDWADVDFGDTTSHMLFEDIEPCEANHNAHS